MVSKWKLQATKLSILDFSIKIFVMEIKRKFFDFIELIFWGKYFRVSYDDCSVWMVSNNLCIRMVARPEKEIYSKFEGFNI